MADTLSITAKHVPVSIPVSSTVFTVWARFLSSFFASEIVPFCQKKGQGLRSVTNCHC